MSTTKNVIVAGSTIFVKIGQTRESMAPGEKRSSKQAATPEMIERVNQKNAERILAIILNYNFRPGDLHLVLTYAGTEPTKEQARKDLEKFKRDLPKAHRKTGSLLKWVSVTEYTHKRIHHHVVCTGGLTIWELSMLWGKGIVRETPLDDTGDYRRLAAYLIKETSKSFRDSDAVSQRRYNCSRSIQKPEVRKDDKASCADILLDPKPIKGYYIDQDSIFRGKNPITGCSYLEYVMISLDPIRPRVKKWNRGKKTKLRGKAYKTERMVQIDFDSVLNEGAETFTA